MTNHVVGDGLAERLAWFLKLTLGDHDLFSISLVRSY